MGCTEGILTARGLRCSSCHRRDRFRILSLHRDQPYLTGTVERFPLEEKAGANRVAVEALRPWVEQYLELLSEAGEMEFDASRLPSEPEEMAYLAATVLQVPALEKQALLAQAGATELLEEMRGLYRRELPLLRAMLSLSESLPEGPGPFSLS